MSQAAAPLEAGQERFLGFVELVAEHAVGGWAFDAANPAEHLTVTVTLDGRPVGQARADGGRPDLAEAGIGDGDHGFMLFFPVPLPNAALPRLQVRVDGGEGALLPRLPGSDRSRADGASNPAIPFCDAEQHPVFVLGPARSGTSALALALLKTGLYQGFGEGHLLPLAQELSRTVEQYYAVHRSSAGTDTFLGSVSHEAFVRAIRRSFAQLAREAFPGGYWVDKTPTAAMVRAAPLMLEIWPNAKFVFMKRRVIENVLSRRRKFPQDTLQNHYLDWVDVMTAWCEVRPALGSAAFEAEQMQMARQNDAFAADVSAFLGMTPEHAELFRRALQEHPEQTADQVGAVASLGSLGLAADDLRELHAACDPTMQAFGYTYDGVYRFETEPGDRGPA